MLRESAGGEHDGTQQAAEKDREFTYRRMTLHKSPIVHGREFTSIQARSKWF
jgi:hypothetical protein